MWQLKSKIAKIKYLKLAGPEAISLLLIVGMVALFFYALPNLPSQAPLLYTLPWGPAQLVNVYLLLILPGLGLILVIFNLGIRSLNREISWLSLAVNILLAISLVKIISSVSPLWPRFFFNFKNIFLPLSVAAIVTWLISGPLIKTAKKLGIIDDPAVHKHPGMLLTKAVPRAGAVAFTISFLIVMLALVPLDEVPWGVVVAVALYTALGVFDDKFDNFFNPYARFGILALGAAIVALSGIGIKSFGTPFGPVGLDFLGVSLPWNLSDKTYLVTDAFTILWIVWVSNLLSWSNGIDGQFAGVAGITALFIALLSLRLIPIDPSQIQTTRIAAIAAGAILGMTPATWHPCKILWGFGATAVGLVLASLAIMSGSKVATASLVVLIPFLDALFTIARRIYHKKSPLWGDRGHLHHKLLDAGLSQPQIAVLYWAVTGILGIAAVFMTGQMQVLALTTLVIFATSVMVLINVKGNIKLPRQVVEALPFPKVKA